MKTQFKRILSGLIALCLILTFMPAGVIHVSAAGTGMPEDTGGRELVKLDFESIEVGTDAVSSGWEVAEGTNAYEAKVQELDGNKVLAMHPVAQEEDRTHLILRYPLGDQYDALTLSYDIAFSRTGGGYFYMPSLGRGTSQLVCLATNTAAPFAYGPSTGGWSALQVTEDGETYTDAGAYEANKWYQVKMEYAKTESGMTVKVYLDGKLTNATAKMTGSQSMENVILFLTKWMDPSTTVYLDNIRVAEPSGEATLAFAQSVYEVKAGEKTTVEAAVSPADAAGEYTVEYSSSNEAVASVDALTGEVTGVSAGTAQITATATSKSDAAKKLTATTGITVLAAASGAVLKLDFEDTPAGTKAEDMGWSYSGEDAHIAEVRNLQGNNVLALKKEASTAHLWMWHPLSAACEKLTMSYNIAFSQTGGGNFFMPSPGWSTNQQVCLATNTAKPFSFQPSSGGWTGIQVTDDGENYTDFGAYSAMTWYTVKIVFDKTAGTVQVYLNGKLTNVTAKQTASHDMENVLLDMSTWMQTSVTVYLDNIYVTVDDHIPASPAELVTDTVTFPQNSYAVTVGGTTDAKAVLSAGAENRYVLSYASSDTDVVTVDDQGTLTGIAAGSAVLTVEATLKTDSRVVLTASAAVTVDDSLPGVEVFSENFDSMTTIEDMTDWTITDTTDGDAKLEIVDNPEGGKMLKLTRRGLKDGMISATLNSGVFRPAGKVELTYKVKLLSGCDTYLPVVCSDQGYVHLFNFGSGNLYYQYPSGSGRESAWIAYVGNGSDEWVDVKIIVDTERNKWFLWYDGAYISLWASDELFNCGTPSTISLFTLSSANTIKGLYFDDFRMRPLTECESVEFDKASYDVVAGNTVQLKLNYTPVDATLQGAIYTSSDETIATVDNEGVVTGLKEGTVTITAEPLCGLPAITTTVNVTYVGIQSITTEDETLEMKVGQTLFPEISILPEIHSETLEYTSSNESVVFADEWGELWARSAGTATVTVSVREKPETKLELSVTVTDPGVLATIYVSPDGSGDGDGSQSNPVSIQRALALVAEKNDDMTGNIEVILAEGYYTVSSTITMTEAHAGTNGYSVIWKAADGATPIIGSAYTISGTQFTATAENPRIYVADVPDWLDSRQMYVNNVRATRARSDGGLTNSQFLMDDDTNIGYICDDVEIADFARVEDLELVFKEEWTQSRIGVASASVVDGKLQMVLDQPGWRYILNKGQTKAKDYGPVWYENALELLDEPGEWYLDTQANKLYYMPRVYEDISAVTVSMPTIDGELLTITGSGYEDAQMVRGLGFEGITFADTTWLRPNSTDGHSDVQNNHIRDYGDHLQTAAVVVKGANGIQFTGCTFTRLGINGLQFIDGVQNVEVVGNKFFDISSDAINVGQPQEGYFPTGNESVKNYEINNNYIHDIGVDFASSAAISVSFASNFHSCHNEIFNIPYSAYHVGYGWANRTEKNLKNLVIANNFIHDYMGEGIYDGGAIYTLGNSNGDGYNLITENYCKNQMNRTGVLYADQGSTWFAFTNNVVDLSEVTAWNGGNKPAWAWINDSVENVLFSGNYTTTDFYGKDGRITIVDDESKLGALHTAMMADNSVYDPANPSAAVQNIIDASGLEAPYAAARNGQSERIVTNLPSGQLMLDVNGTFSISINLTTGKDQTVSGGNLTVAYDVADSGIATISQSGVVTGLTKGTTKLYIYVVSNNIEDVLEIPVVVGDTLKELVFENMDGEIRMSVSSNGKQLVPTILTELGFTIKPDSVTYTVADDTVAKVSADGLVTPVAAGETTVTVLATAGSQSISVTIPVVVTELDMSSMDDLWEIFDKDKEEFWTRKDNGGSTWELTDGERIVTQLNGYSTFAGAAYGDEILTFRLKIDDSTGGGNWPTFVLRAESDASYVSADLVDGYMFCMAKDGIAVYRFNDGTRYQIYGNVSEGGSCTNVIKQGGVITDSPWSMKEEHEIQVGAIADGDDVRVILNIDGVKVIDFVDPGAQKAITEPGYFGIIGRGETFTLSKVSVYDNIEDNIWEIFDQEKEPQWTKKIGSSDTWELVDDTSITAKINGFCTFTGAEYDKELMHFQLKIDHATGGGNWPAIVLKAESDTSYVSADLVDGYMFCLAKGGIDVFRFIDGVRYQIYGNVAEGGSCTNVCKQGGTITDSNWSMQETHDIRVGAITDGSDVRVMLIIDGEEVVNYVDLGANKAITKPGYFGIIGRGETFTLTKISTGTDTVSVTASGSGVKDTEFAPQAERDSAYSFKVTMDDGWLYEVNAAMSGNPVNLTEKADGVFELARVTGDINLVINKTEQEKPEAVKNVEALIEAIGDVTLDSEEAIQAARNAYENLTDEQKAMVSNYETLTTAEARLAELKAEQTEPTEQEPTDPEPAEQFQPKRFDVRISSSKVNAGSKVTVTVTTSKDVDSITVNGETVTSYSSAMWGTVRIWKVKMDASTEGELPISVTAYNADGLASETIVKTVTVIANRPGGGSWLEKIFDWITGIWP